MLRNETRRLQSNMRRYTGDDTSSIPFEELDEVEQELERSVIKVRDRKVTKQSRNGEKKYALHFFEVNSCDMNS